MQTDNEVEQNEVKRVWSDVGYVGVRCLVMQTECMNESRVWWEECGAGLDMQTGYEGEQGVVGRVEQSWICRQGMKESRVC